MRKRRQILEGARYHVVARANRQEFILNSRKIKGLFLNCIKRAKKRYRFSVDNFCIMGNHIHLVMKPHRNENLSRIMQWILSVFAINFNTILNLKGHVWYDRFKSKILYNLRQFIRAFLYVAENPVKAGIVSKPEEFEYNGVAMIQKGIYEVVNPPDIFIRMLLPEIGQRLIQHLAE